MNHPVIIVCLAKSNACAFFSTEPTSRDAAPQQPGQEAQGELRKRRHFDFKPELISLPKASHKQQRMWG